MAENKVFPCMSCRVGFRSAESHRLHHKTDWHRYNLKRKIADLPPVSAADFKARVLAQQQALLASQDKGHANLKCIACNKKFKSKKAYETHLASKNHKTRQAAFDKQGGRVCPPATATSVATRPGGLAAPPAAAQGGGSAPGPADGAMDDTADAEDAAPEGGPVTHHLDLEDCIFSNHRSESLEANLKYMRRTHGFFIPDIEYCTNLSALVAYLQSKVGEYHMCLQCNKQFWSFEAARNHMTSKGHCFIAYDEEGQLELEEFYDFRSSYPEYRPDVDDAATNINMENPVGGLHYDGGADSGAEVDSKAGGAEQMDDGNDSDWETDDEGAADGEGNAYKDMQLSETTKKNVLAHRAFQVEKVHKDGLELVLPGGKRLGHRDLKRYYKQRFANEDTRDSVVIGAMVAEYKGLGLVGLGSGAVTKEERRIRDNGQRIAVRAYMRMGISNNKSEGNQHFREQNTQ